MDSQESFREHVERLVAESKLTQAEADELLGSAEPPQAEAEEVHAEDSGPAAYSLSKPGWAAVQGQAAELDSVPPQLLLKVEGYSLQVVLDLSLAQPQLSANHAGELQLQGGPDGWTVTRIPGLRTRQRGVRAVLSLPFVPSDVRAEISGGNLTLCDASGAVRVRVNGGNLTLGNAAELDAQVNGGNLGARQIAGATRLRVSGGNARLEGAGGVEATVNGGNLNWSGRLIQGEHRIFVNAGNVTLRLQEGSSVAVQADVTLGGMTASFPLVKTGGMMHSHYSGTVGGGEAQLGCTVNAGQLRMLTP